MEKHYRFFQHTQCEYYPCHDVEGGAINCLFCFCPLYALGEKCGGAFRYTEQGIKDCSDCTFPHRAENYDAVMSRFDEIARMAAQEPER